MRHTGTGITPATARRISIAAWAMAAVGTVVGELHALARINSHPEDLESALTRAWAVPAMDRVRPLLDWADPYFVYWTYGKIWLPICLAFAAAAYLVYRHRQPHGAEKWAWRVQLAAYAILAISVTGDYYTPWTEQFFVVGLIALPIIAFGGPVLGITLLLNGYRPRTTAWLLILFLPFFAAITSVTSMGNALLPLMWGWALAAHRLVHSGEGQPHPTSTPSNMPTRGEPSPNSSVQHSGERLIQQSLCVAEWIHQGSRAGGREL